MAEAERQPEMLSRDCPLCSASGTRAGVLLEKPGVRLVRCPACAMVFSNPVSAAMVSGQFYDEAGASYYLSPAKLESDYASVRFDRELRIFRRHCAGGSVLDVGCSSGAFLWQLRNRFPEDYQVLGTDVSGPTLDYAESRGLRVVRRDFLAYDFGVERFDAITFWAVLEHLERPGAFLAKAASLLKPGGLCIVLVPNLHSLAVRWLGARYRYVYPQHLNYWTRETLAGMAKASFKLVELRSMHFNPMVIWQDWRGGGKEVSNAQRAELLKKTTAAKANPWLGPVRVGYRLMEALLGKVFLADNLVMVAKQKDEG